MQQLSNMRFAPDLLKDRIALVTGGGTGMGRATAIEMARCGASVVVLGRRAGPGRMGDVEDISAAIIFLSSPLGKFVTGEEWYIDGGETLHLAHDARQMIDAAKFSRREPAVAKTK